MWMVIHIVANPQEGDQVCDLLRQEGLLATWRWANEGKEGGVEVLVPEGEAQEAHEILFEAFQK